MLENLTTLVERGLSTRQLAKELGTTQSTIRRRLKEAGLVTKPKSRIDGLDGFCKLCGRVANQYDNRRRSVCGSCWTRIRRYRMKKRAVELLGGKCRTCGWSGHLAGYDFHHDDPSQKDFNIGMVANKSWSVIVVELRKCSLLCRICHAIEHSSERGEVFLRLAAGES